MTTPLNKQPLDRGVQMRMICLHIEDDDDNDEDDHDDDDHWIVE